jgi:serine/threonine-protein kinase
LIRKLGSGGMSEVFLARPLDPRRAHERYALKKLLPDLVGIPNFVQLFRAESDISSRLDHPNVVRVVASGVVGDEFYMLTEYVEGLDCWRLTRRLARQVRTLDLADVARVVSATLEGLAYLHELAGPDGRPLGIVHRDISPSNILVSRRGDVKVGDFGIALIPSRELEERRRARLRGKIRYLSPEQVRGLPLDARSDLFAVGVLLAELIIGRSPFRGQTDIALLLNIRDVRLHLAEDLDERTPPALRGVLMRALSRDPCDRYADARAMLRDLVAFAEASDLDPSAERLALTVESLLKPGDVGDEAISRETLTPAMHAPIAPRARRAEEQTPATPVLEFRVRPAVGGRDLGPVSYAELVEMVIHEKIGPEDRIDSGGGTWRRLADVPEIRRHLPLLTPTTTRIEGPGIPDRQGDLEHDGTAAVFLLVLRGRETGLLVFDSGAVRKEVYVEGGHPVYASSNLPSELLGEFLVGRKVLSRLELEMALAMLPRYDGHLGDTLVALELVDPLTLFEHITEQVRYKIVNLYGWRSGAWTLFRGVTCEKRIFPLSTSGADLLREGIHTGYALDEIEAWWGTVRSRRVANALAPDPPAGEWVLGTADQVVLEALASARTVESVTEAARARFPGLDREAILRSLHFLVTAGLIDVG